MDIVDAETSSKLLEGPHKVLVIGESGIGKTSLIRRYVDGVFNKNYCPTLGVDFALKIVDWTKTQKVRLQLWDIAGQERFSSLTRVYYQQATACIIVFDLSRKPTFQAVLKWKEDLDAKTALPNDEPLPCLLIANKCDLNVRQVSKEEIAAFVEAHGFIGCFETSAKDDVGINDSMRFLTRHILASLDGEIAPNTNNGLKLDGESTNQSQCAC